jgi:hypothetical protein
MGFESVEPLALIVSRSADAQARDTAAHTLGSLVNTSPAHAQAVLSVPGILEAMAENLKYALHCATSGLSLPPVVGVMYAFVSMQDHVKGLQKSRFLPFCTLWLSLLFLPEDSLEVGVKVDVLDVLEKVISACSSSIEDVETLATLSSPDFLRYLTTCVNHEDIQLSNKAGGLLTAMTEVDAVMGAMFTVDFGNLLLTMLTGRNSLQGSALIAMYNAMVDMSAPPDLFLDNEAFVSFRVFGIPIPISDSSWIV